MDPVIIGALIGLVGAAACSVVLFRGVFLRGTRPAGAATTWSTRGRRPRPWAPAQDVSPEQLRYTLGVVLWAFVSGLAMLALVCLVMGLVIQPAPGEGRRLPDAVLLLAGAVIALASVAILGTWGRFVPAVGEPAADVARAYRRAIVMAAVWDGLGVAAVAFLLLGVY